MPKGGHWCSAPRCTSNTNTDKNLSFFRFPKDEARAKRWVMNCRRVDLLSKNADYLYMKCKICSKHFEHSMFYNFLRNRLKRNAAPTLFACANSPEITIKTEELLLKTETPDDVETDAQLQTPISTKSRNIEFGIQKSMPVMSPRMEVLRRRWKVKNQTIRKLRRQIITSTAKHFEDLCCKFLPEHLAQFAITQAEFYKTSGNGQGS